MDNIYELMARYDSRKSFYGKAHVIEDGDRKVLKSYNTYVCYIENGIPYNMDGSVITGTRYGWSQTTNRHIKEFIKQFATA